MAVNQAQVDHIISTASADDPEVKLLKLQDEVELIKNSIKRLLIDIRERMNDMENPIVIRESGIGTEGLQRIERDSRETNRSTESQAETIRVIQQAAKSEEGIAGQAAEQPGVALPQADAQPGGFPLSQKGQREAVPAGSLDLLSALKAQLGTMPHDEEEVSRDIEAQKVRLQKVFQLFEWTSRNVKQFGHDRVDLMLDAYQAMGYISETSCKLVKDMTRLMPTSIGELHEIKADEFVSELYELNHILNPADSTLDRDMIEVLMEKREGKDTQKLLAPARKKEEEPAREYLQSRDEL